MFVLDADTRTLYHFDGALWSPVRTVSSDAVSLLGGDAHHVYLAGESGLDVLYRQYSW